MSTTEKERREALVFLFGAGASVDAGVPDTYSFVKEFESYVNNERPEFGELLSRILKIREKYNVKLLGEDKKSVDVEQLLDTLRRLIGRDKEPLLYFYNNLELKYKLKQSELLFIERFLQNFIRRKVVIENQKNLEYLQELFSFDSPVEIFSTNYDTCIEQSCYLNHRSYTDGFDITWNENNFKNYDVFHYKLHGSVIWYQNEKTKECIKIPVSAFVEMFEDPIDLRLIYGEDVKPLLIYPAQKSEYVEPLTDLQLMFKKTLFQRAKFLVVVGYSFRDEYIIHMLWDAARANEDLNVIIVDPNAQELYETKLRYVDKNTKALSRLSGKVFCLPYPFSTIIHLLKNNYLRALQNIIRTEKGFLEQEKSGDTPDWQSLLRTCLQEEFTAKAQSILEKKIRKSWNELEFNPSQTRLQMSFRSLLHSIISKDGFEDIWLQRVNDSLTLLSVDNLKITNSHQDCFLFGLSDERNDLRKVVSEWINPLLDENNRKLELLTPKFKDRLNPIIKSIKKLEALSQYFINLRNGVNPWEYKVFENDTGDIRQLIDNIQNAIRQNVIPQGEFKKWTLEIEKARLRNFLNADRFEFKLLSEQEI